MSKYQAVLFDLDGTLMDTSEGILSSVKYTIDVMGFEPIDDDYFETFIGPPIQHTLQRIYHLDDATRDKAAAVFREHYSTVDLCKAKLYDGVLETLSELKQKGIKIAVATYKREDYTTKLLDEFGISPYCDWIQGSDFAGKLTKADIIELCLQKLNVDKSKVLMVGDTEHDMIGAQNAGVDFLAVTFGFGFHDSREYGSAASCFSEIIIMMESEP